MTLRAAGRSEQRLTRAWEIDSAAALRRSAFSGKLGVMFVIELIYTASLDAIDAHMAAHVKFLKKYYASGHFLVSGRKIPRDGGVILAVARNRQEVEAIVEEDPFRKHRLAECRIIEFRASQRATDFPLRTAGA